MQVVPLINIDIIAIGKSNCMQVIQKINIDINNHWWWILARFFGTVQCKMSKTRLPRLKSLVKRPRISKR